jgi:hypothetical protein
MTDLSKGRYSYELIPNGSDRRTASAEQQASEKDHHLTFVEKQVVHGNIMQEKPNAQIGITANHSKR